MGRADYLALGDWNVQCFQCGFKRKASTMQRNWQGYYVCPEHNEPRQMQDFVRATPDFQTPPWVQPMPAAVYTYTNQVIGFGDGVNTFFQLGSGLYPISVIQGSVQVNGVPVNYVDNGMGGITLVVPAGRFLAVTASGVENVNETGSYTPTLPQQQAAATNAGNAYIAGGGADSWMEIGLATGAPLWNNNGQPFGGGTVTHNTQVVLASVTKSLSAMGALSILGPSLSILNYKILCMMAGYDLMRGSYCSTGPTETIHTCAITTHTSGPLAGVMYTQYDAARDNLFAYDLASWQYLFDTVLSLGLDKSQDLANFYISLFGLGPTDIFCTTPMPGGGAQATPDVLRVIIRQLMLNTGGAVNMRTHLLDPTFIPFNSSHITGGSPGVFFSPAPLGQTWRYKSGFWIEDGTGDYWMAGSFGSSIWIKKDFSMYGMLIQNGNGVESGSLSMDVFQIVRDAFLSGSYP